MSNGSVQSDGMPYEVEIDPFEKKLRGVFGRFQTRASFPVYYLLTSIPIARVADLRTAAEEFRVDELTFDQLIQRDIDQSRVADIAREYLEKGAGKVLFFPPLLLSIVVKDSQGGIKERYSSVQYEHPGESQKHSVLTITWDVDKFRLLLPTTNGPTQRRRIEAEDKAYGFFEFGAQLHYNPQDVRLIVIDGQHRLESLRLLHNNPAKREIVGPIEIPACIVFSPAAHVDSQESVVLDLRNLFVTVNNEGKKVSGHFITLLKDDSLAAETVRLLATRWKDDQSKGYNFLHHLEWNEREERRTAQLNRPFSLTTLRIVADVVQAHLFDQRYGYTLMNLASCESELASVAPDFAPTEVSDSEWPHSAREILRRQIDNEIVPALDSLLRSPVPYRAVQDGLQRALSELDAKVHAGSTAFVHLQDRLNKHRYSDQDLGDFPETKAAFEQFISWMQPDARRSVYGSMVFQQALIRTWIALASDLKNEGIAPAATARALSNALSVMCMIESKEYLSPGRAYAGRTLYRGDRLNVGSRWALDTWQRLVQGSLLHQPTRKAFVESLKQQGAEVGGQKLKEVVERLRKGAEECIEAFLETYFEETEKDIRKRYADMGYAEGVVKRLMELESSDDAMDNQEFGNEIRKLAKKKYDLAKLELANMLDVKGEGLKTITI